MMITVAKFIILLGIIFLLIGGLLYLVARSGLPIGRLPGDIRLQWGNFTCLFALGTSILLSVVLTLLLNLIVRLLNK